MKKQKHQAMRTKILIVIAIFVLVIVVKIQSRKNVFIEPSNLEVYENSTFQELMDKDLILSDPMECTFTLGVSSRQLYFIKKLILTSKKEIFQDCDNAIKYNWLYADGFAVIPQDSFLNRNFNENVLEFLKCIGVEYSFKDSCNEEKCLVEIKINEENYFYDIIDKKDYFIFVFH
jgi:hypothetical protein